MNSTLLPIHVDEGYSGKDLEEDEEEVERGKEKTSKRDCYKKRLQELLSAILRKPMLFRWGENVLWFLKLLKAR